VRNRLTTAKTLMAIIVLLFMFISLSSFERVEKGGVAVILLILTNNATIDEDALSFFSLLLF
jgi:hypothetical protein